MKHAWASRAVSWLALFISALAGGCTEAKQVVDLAQTMADHRAKGPMHERLKWKAEDFFTDAGVINLCEAIEARDLAEIRQLVRSGVDVNARGRGNMTPLLWAFPMGESVFRTVLKLGADPNVALTRNYLNLQGKSVTFAAVKLVDGPIYKQCFYDVPMDNYLSIVLENGGNPNQEDLSGETPLFDTALSEPRKLSKKIHLLLDAGGDVNHQNYQGDTPLLSASQYRFDAKMALLKSGADYRIPNKYGFDVILRLQQDRTDRESKGERGLPTADAEALFDWLTKEGVSWEAARTALSDQDLMKNLKNLPADYQHRPWLPQRPTLKKADE